MHGKNLVYRQAHGRLNNMFSIIMTVLLFLLLLNLII